MIRGWRPNSKQSTELMVSLVVICGLVLGLQVSASDFADDQLDLVSSLVKSNQLQESRHQQKVAIAAPQNSSRSSGSAGLDININNARDMAPELQLAEPDVLRGAESKISITQMDTLRTKSGPFPSLDGSDSDSSVHHRIWTASSSDSIDEISPEMISKIRGADMPFLAAYAVRPRLVGAQTGNQVSDMSTEKPSQENQSGRLQAEASSASSTSTTGDDDLARLKALGEFNELRLETSSVSKSEHRHNKRTTFSKKQQKPSTELTLRRKILRDASKLVRLNNRKLNKRTLRRRRSKRRASRGKFALNNYRQTGKLRRRMEAKNLARLMNVMKFQRLLQDANEIAMNDAKATMASDSNSDSGVKGGQAMADKKPFYSAAAPAKPQIGEANRNGDSTNDDDDEAPMRVGEPDVEEDGDTVQVEPKYDGVPDDPEYVADDNTIGKGNKHKDTADEDTINVDMDDAQSAKPAANDESSTSGSKRKEGESHDGEEQAGDDDGDTEEDEKDTSKPTTKRTKSVDKDDDATNDDDDDDVDAKNAVGGGIGATTGAGQSGSSDRLKPSSNGDTDVDGDDDDDRVRNNRNDSERRRRVEPSVEFADGADKDSDQDGAINSDSGSGSSGSEGSRSSNPGSSLRGSNDGNQGDDDDKERSRDADMDVRVSKSGAGSEKDDREDNGLDDIRDRKRAKSDSNDSSNDDDKSQGDDNDDGADDDHDGGRGYERKRNKVDRDDKSEAKQEHNSPGSSDCHHDDGSYDHHEHHHGHHDHRKWLEDAIPGEPGEDYPILSRANTTNFRCSEHKWPGYYADVESRCQVFHICQADGRQDSFLCPNGTIFSQTSRVCVWWNSFDCDIRLAVSLAIVSVASSHFHHRAEAAVLVAANDTNTRLTISRNHDHPDAVSSPSDAPSLYKLNAELYKDYSKDTNLKPLGVNMAAGMRRQLAADNRRNDGIDGLIMAMRRGNKELEQHDDDEAREAIANDNGAVMMMLLNRSKGPDANSNSNHDEASVQRKSSSYGDEHDASLDLDPDDGASQTSRARLRRRLAYALEPRRAKRGTSRQPPPKLRSTRVLRGSKKLRLRHGAKPKPRRRA